MGVFGATCGAVLEDKSSTCIYPLVCFALEKQTLVAMLRLCHVLLKGYKLFATNYNKI